MISLLRRVLRLLVLTMLPGVVVVTAATAEPGTPTTDAVTASSSPDSSSSESVDGADEPSEEKAKDSPVLVRYRKGLRFETEDKSFSARVRWRVQLRATDVSSSDLVGEEDGVEEQAGFRIRRSRFKLDGHAYKEWLKYYIEYSFSRGALLTWRFEMDRNEKLSYRVGQYKVVYNRERVDSSGKQQFADRSIVNDPFTVDRQQGMHLSGRLFKDSAGDSRYWVGVFTGTGRGGELDEDERPMYVGRWQWNFLKRAHPFAQSDTERTPKMAASLALAGASNRGRFSSWSSSGGGQLPGLPAGEPGQYRTEQWMVEFALMRRGLSVQSEYHSKQVDDTIAIATTELDGYYAQVGFFFHEAFDFVPKKLEFALRSARVDTTLGVLTARDREASLAANYFFYGHDSKLTADLSYLEAQLIGGSEDDGWRVRLQWDVSF